MPETAPSSTQLLLLKKGFSVVTQNDNWQGTVHYRQVKFHITITYSNLLKAKHSI